MSRIVTRFFLTSPLSIFSRRRRPTFLLPSIGYMTSFCVFSSGAFRSRELAELRPCVTMDRIFAPPIYDSNSRLECGWTPPLRVSCITKDIYRLIACCGENWTRGGRHWLVTMHLLGTEVDTEQELFDYYIKVLAWYLGSEEEAKKRIYLVSYGCCYGFGAELDYQTSHGDVADVCEDIYYYARKRDPNVGSADPFLSRNLNFRLNNLFSYHHLSVPNSKWNSDHWLISVAEPEPDDGEIYDFCIKMLAEVVGSEEAAAEKVYIIWRKLPFGFAAEIDEGGVEKLRGMAGVLKVLPDYAFDVKETYHTNGGGYYSDINTEFVRWKHRALRVNPSSHGLRYSSYHFVGECNSEESCVSIAEHFDGSDDSSCFHTVRSRPKSRCINQNHLLNDIFSYHHLSERNSEWKFNHWLIHIKQQNSASTTEQQTIDFCFRMLANALGSERNARRKIYVVWCTAPVGFGAEIDEETSNKLKALPDVLAVLPDYAFDVMNKINGVLAISPASFLRFRRTLNYTPLLEEKVEYDCEDVDTIKGLRKRVYLTRLRGRERHRRLRREYSKRSRELARDLPIKHLN